MIKPSLLVLAAGMASRYGSLKQMDGVGPNGEAIIDYSVADAIRAGFGKVVFVIRRSFAEEFREVFSAERFGGKIQVEYVYQELDALPEGFSLPEDRVKPWGTNHAVMMGADVIGEPFAVINADDFYGRAAFEVMAQYLMGLGEGSSNRYCMVAYNLGNTLSDNGTVSRGVCTIGADSMLSGMIEHTKIERDRESGEIVDRANSSDMKLLDSTPVSMNLFGFTSDYFAHCYDFFVEFLRTRGSELTSECYMPSVVNRLIESGVATVEVLHSPAKWFGVTYKADREPLQKQLQQMIGEGVYSSPLEF